MGPTGFVKVVKASQGRPAATHAATETGELACGTWTRLGAPVTEIGTDLAATTHVTETVYRHVIVPAILGGATVMDTVFGADDGHGAGGRPALLAVRR